jgi:putative transposase
LAARQKNARRQAACIVVLDESGLLMAPLVRRSWAPRGQPSFLLQKGGHREKVSVAGALWLSPTRDRLGLYFETIINGYFNNEAVAGFLEDMMRWLRKPAIILWDGGTMHKGDPIEELLLRKEGRLTLECLPAHTPELMPMEPCWSWLKYGRLCNFAPENGAQLNERVLDELQAIQDNQELLQGFYHASDLPLPRALLT